MPAKKTKTKIDPELTRQLQRVQAADEPIEAVFQLGSEDGAVLPPDRVEELAKQLVDRAERESGAKVDDVNVFRHLASFVVRGSPDVVRSLVEQPEVSAAVANRQPASS
jgi:hypothetical protein